MTGAPRLAYTERSLPGSTLDSRLEFARTRGLAIEAANHGRFDGSLYRNAGLDVVSLQAYRMHEFHPLHPDPNCRREARTHVIETLERASRNGIPRIVTVCGFGHQLADRPFDRSLDFFSSVAGHAAALGVRIMIEPLSPLRLAAMNRPEDILRLMKALDDPDAFSVILDTGHLLDSGIELDTFFSNWSHPVEELQLKGPDSAPPDPEMPFGRWLASLPAPPAVICIEHREPVTVNDGDRLVSALKTAIEN